MTRLLRGLFLTLFAAAVILPMVWVVVNSLKSTSEIISTPWALPLQPRWGNYVKAWTEGSIGRYFFNSLLICFATLAILLPVSAMASYILAKFPFKGSQVIFTGFLGGLMFPQFLVIVPLFLLMRDLGALNTQWGLVLVYVAFSLPFTIFVLTGFFSALPDELAEAATIDGCTDAQTFWRVMMPLAKPGLVVALIFNIIGLWNEYNLALILLNTPDRFTLPLGLANLMSTNQYTSDWGALFAAIVIVMSPVLLAYWLLKEKIQEAMLAGAIKG
ncbi:MAG: carbohydrate ABC transporter permease [Fimbriimonadaceae bacterium]|nr:carbohydrate ABC transporter permease [Fimbriimonadaceae bacterium]